MLDKCRSSRRKNYSDIHVVGTNEVPDKAKGAAWSYGLKYYLLNKFNIVQATTEDPDMRGPAPDGDKTKKKKVRNQRNLAKKQNQNDGADRAKEEGSQRRV